MPHLFGVSLEVYLFLFVIALPLFFLWKWLLNKKFKAKSTTLYSVVATILTVPVIYVCLILCWGILSSYYPDKDFDREAWSQDKEKRYEYTHSLNEDRLLEGKTPDQVLEYLGEPDYKENNTFIYYIGFKPRLMGIDPDWLKIEFENEIFSEMSEYNS